MKNALESRTLTRAEEIMGVTFTVRIGCVVLGIGGSAAMAQSPSPRGTPGQPAAHVAAMESVIGIGGFFFRASNPRTLAEWYERHLGVTLTPTSYDTAPWRQEAGPTVFAPFAADTKYFGRSTQQWMINFRVRSLEAMVAQLTRAGISVEVDPQTYPNGRFARLQDPEGNPIQLWEAKNPAAPPQ